ncbi:MAG: isochorismate synthase [Cyclobacteriaceae bacterium]
MSAHSLDALNALSTTTALQRIFDTAKSNDYSFAFYRLPNTSNFTIILSSKEVSKQFLNSRETTGFAVSLFISSDCQGHLIPEDLLISYQDSFSIKGSSEVVNTFISLLDNNTQKPTTTSLTFTDTPKKAFTDGVNSAISEINKGTFKKVVLAKTKNIALNQDFSISSVLNKISTEYERAFVSYVSSPAFGDWLTASPEILLEIKDKQHFKTVSLAATQQANGTSIKLVSWNQKEIEEQAYVSRYIIDCLKKIRLRGYEEIGPRTVKAGNLLHLKTDFLIDMEKTGYPDLGNQMLELLHPTSAVCGMPKEKALDFITTHEVFDRELYTGYLGPLNIENTTCLAVNLRCAKLTDSHATLFAGAGITEDSDAEQEWQETEIKCETLGRFLV